MRVWRPSWPDEPGLTPIQSRLDGVRVLTNLDLHGTTPTRIQPEVGEWGPVEVMPTRNKRRARVLWIAAFVAVIVALFVFGHIVYDLVMNSGS